MHDDLGDAEAAGLIRSAKIALRPLNVRKKYPLRCAISPWEMRPWMLRYVLGPYCPKYALRSNYLVLGVCF
jgi:hypothetical protein